MTFPGDVSALQRLASDPTASAWVGASAGSGKTKVLTDRLLTLMLKGCGPERLLCLTFTKAAAAEMSIRLMKRLAKWAVATNTQLREDVTTLLGAHSTEEQLTQARGLFTQVLETPGGMKILTLHSFCHAILSRFPLEAQISPHFSVMDDNEAEDLLQKARDQILLKEDSEECQRAISLLTNHLTDSSFHGLLQDINQQKAAFKQVLKKFPTFSQRLAYCHHTFEIPESLLLQSENLLDQILTTTYTLTSIQAAIVRELVKNDPAMQKIVHLWVEDPAQRPDIFHDYKRFYLTLSDDLLKKPKIDFSEEAEAIFQVQKLLNRAELAQKTLCLQTLADHILSAYSTLKQQKSVLDYDDLIDYTQKLLEKPDIAAWVLYKLEGGFDHLLIDEAQDTNPRQWQIIRALTAEFFTTQQSHRTIFAVGDVKQSIYSFQGAKPKEFKVFRGLFEADCLRSGQLWRDIEMDVSFRSTPPILKVVDTVFKDPLLQAGVSLDEEEICHQSFRTNHKGCVEVWPVIHTFAELEEPEPWTVPPSNHKHNSASEELATFITHKIKKWLENPFILPSTGLPIQPKDILILVRKRSDFSENLIWRLKKNEIPVTGADRFLLTSHLAVVDLMALGNFLCLPTDDYSLACVLKSPLVGVTEEQLFNLSHNRSGSLWAELKNQSSQDAFLTQAYSFLTFCLQKVDFITPYELYANIFSLQEGRKKFIARFGYEVEEVLTEFLNQVLVFEKKSLPTLQGFLTYLSQKPIFIKRELTDNPRNEVRLMTVHGAKGLQAPVVIIPENIDSLDQREGLLWQSTVEEAAHFVFIRPSLDKDTPLTKALKNHHSLWVKQENARLLYVALTRAQDHLYVCGWRTKKETQELPESWYKKVSEALLTLESVTLEDGTQHFSNIPDKPLDFVLIAPLSGADFPLLPPWIKEPLSNAQTNENSYASAALAPLKTVTYCEEAAKRGILIHHLFEVLPDFPPTQWKRVGQQLIVKAGYEAKLYEEELNSVIQILSYEPYAPLFGPESYAELDLCEGEAMGRIDRVAITPTHIYILDYKTSISPPSGVEQVPKAYKEQLTFYATILKSLYPHHHIETYLLWTQGPYLMKMS